MPPLTTYFGIILAVYILAECVNLYMVGSSLIGWVLRIVRQVLHGTKEVALPADLKIAVTNGLLKVGSEVVVETEYQWDGITVKRFAISPTIAHAAEGTIMRIIRLARNSMELKPLANSDCEVIQKCQLGE
jgi:hypothetical protein